MNAPLAVTIELTKGFSAVIDAEDEARVREHSWSAMVTRVRGLVYAQTSIGKKIRLLHRFVLGLAACEDGLVVDHRDGDGLNCRKLNLRVVTDAVNKRNRRSLHRLNVSGHNDVRWDKDRSRWRVEMSIDRVRHFVGRFHTIEEAVAARNVAMKEYGY